MKRQAFQPGEIRDENDNIIRPGAYNKHTPFADASNQGIIDYIINNFDALQENAEALRDSIDEAGYVRRTGTETITGDKTFSGAVTLTSEAYTPTANQGNSSKAIANTEFVARSIAALVNSAPETLNTLSELATALGNDPNFAATVAEALGKKADAKEVEDTYLTKVQHVNDGHYIQRNTTYAVGDVLQSPALPPGYILVVTEAGTTGSTEPDWNTLKNNMGGVINDNNLKFIIKDLKCRHEVGDIVPKVGTPKDYEYLLLADGSSFDRVRYPQLAEIFPAGKLPNLNDGRFLEGRTTAGTFKAAGLPNITGQVGGGSGAGNGSGVGIFRNTMISGAFAPTYKANAEGSPAFESTNKFPDGTPYFKADFDASKSNAIYGASNTVQPKSYTVRYYICYA